MSNLNERQFGTQPSPKRNYEIWGAPPAQKIGMKSAVKLSRAIKGSK